MEQSSDVATTNCLIDALPDADRLRIESACEVVPLARKEQLLGGGAPASHVYFPAHGFCSLVSVLRDGRMVEVATIGREGAIGTNAATDGRHASAVVVVQAPMSMCYRMPMKRFREELRSCRAFADLMSRYNDALVGTIVQAAACNAVHGVEKRLARWLLMAHDRVAHDRFLLTQEAVAMMLGVTRPTVTVVARGLQADGVITYHRGRLVIHDRPALERAACECYAVMTTELRAVADVTCLPNDPAPAT